MKAPWDVVALFFGLIRTGVAVASLWLSFAGSLNWSVLRTATPIALVAVGGIGLAISRRS